MTLKRERKNKRDIETKREREREREREQERKRKGEGEKVGAGGSTLGFSAISFHGWWSSHRVNGHQIVYSPSAASKYLLFTFLKLGLVAANNVGRLSLCKCRFPSLFAGLRS